MLFPVTPRHNQQTKLTRHIGNNENFIQQLFHDLKLVGGKIDRLWGIG